MPEIIDELSHKVSITIEGRYTHGFEKHAHIEIYGDGELDHMLAAFRAALVSTGVAMETINSVRICDEQI